MNVFTRLGKAFDVLKGVDQEGGTTKSERPINLLGSANEAKRNSDPEKGKKWLDGVIMRVAWMYAIGDENFQKEDILEIIAMSKKGEPVTRMMYDALFVEGAKFELRFYRARNSERPDEWITHDEYNTLSESQRSEWHPVVYYRVEGSTRYTVYDGRDDSWEGDVAKRFADCFFVIACEFGNYKDVTGKKRYTLDPSFSGTGAAVCIGVNDQGPFCNVEFDFSPGKLTNLKEEDQDAFLEAVEKAIEHLKGCKAAATRYILGDTSTEKDKDKAPTYDKCKLDFLAEEVRKSDNETFVEEFEKLLKAQKEKGKDTERIYRLFVLSERYPDQVTKAEKAYEKYVEELSEEKKGKSKDDEETDPPKQKYDKRYLPKRTLADWRRMFKGDADFMKLYNGKFFKDLSSSCHILDLIHYIKTNGKPVSKVIEDQKDLDIAFATEKTEEAKAKAESDDDGSGDE